VSHGLGGGSGKIIITIMLKYNIIIKTFCNNYKNSFVITVMHTFIHVIAYYRVCGILFQYLLPYCIKIIFDDKFFGFFEHGQLHNKNSLAKNPHHKRVLHIFIWQ